MTGVVDWTNMAPDREKWRVPVNMVMNLRVPHGTGISLLAEKRLHSQVSSVVYLANYVINQHLLYFYQLEKLYINLCKLSTVYLCHFMRYGK
jgi:hypothetical protein